MEAYRLWRRCWPNNTTKRDTIRSTRPFCWVWCPEHLCRMNNEWDRLRYIDSNFYPFHTFCCVSRVRVREWIRDRMYETDNMIVDVLHIVDDAFHADERINQIFFFLASAHLINEHRSFICDSTISTGLLDGRHKVKPYWKTIEFWKVLRLYRYSAVWSRFQQTRLYMICSVRILSVGMDRKLTDTDFARWCKNKQDSTRFVIDCDKLIYISHSKVTPKDR